jgi:hypothetical protein
MPLECRPNCYFESAGTCPSIRHTDSV